METLFKVLIPIIVLLIGVLVFLTYKKNPYWFIPSHLLVIAATILICACVIERGPTALDVYRGKTSLSVTEVYVDSYLQSRDSLVIYKSVIDTTTNIMY